MAEEAGSAVERSEMHMNPSTRTVMPTLGRSELGFYRVFPYTFRQTQG